MKQRRIETEKIKLKYSKEILLLLVKFNLNLMLKVNYSQLIINYFILIKLKC